MVKKGGKDSYSLDIAKLDTGVKMILKTIDGQDSDDFVMVRSRWSDPVRFAVDDADSAIAMKRASTGKVSTKDRAEIIRSIHVVMIANWKLSKPGPTWPSSKPNEKQIEAWLKAHPHYAEAIDLKASDTRLFMLVERSSSTGSSKK
jgi:hypothetical protein